MYIDITNKNRYEFDTRKETTKKEYFSGANVRVYFGNIHVDQMAAISFNMQEQVTPIYGFNSYRFDKIARGSRIVSGTFTLSFTENGYLQTILDRLSSGIDAKNNNLMWEEQVEALKKDIPRETSARTIENILSMREDGTYEDYIEGLKSSFWGDVASGNTVSRSTLSKEHDTYYYPKAEGSRWENPLKEHGFNILIDYSPEANQKDFQDCLSDMEKKGSLYQTYRSIVGVHITGESQDIAPDGDVLRTHYTFVARDLDGDVQELSMKHNYLQETILGKKPSRRIGGEDSLSGSRAGGMVEKLDN